MYDLTDSLSSDPRFVIRAAHEGRSRASSWSVWNPDVGDPAGSSMATDPFFSTRKSIVSRLRALGSVLSQSSAAVEGWHVKWESDGWLVSLLVSEHSEGAYEAAFRVQQAFGNLDLRSAEFRVVALQGRPVSEVVILLDGHTEE